jgi:hypothetical protein
MGDREEGSLDGNQKCDTLVLTGRSFRKKRNPWLTEKYPFTGYFSVH